MEAKLIATINMVAGHLLASLKKKVWVVCLGECLVQSKVFLQGFISNLFSSLNTKLNKTEPCLDHPKFEDLFTPNWRKLKQRVWCWEGCMRGFNSFAVVITRLFGMFWRFWGCLQRLPFFLWRWSDDTSFLYHCLTPKSSHNCVLGLYS